MSSENKNGKVPLISKIAYGFGDVGCNFSWMFVSNFLMIFYTDVFGISMAAVSALMLFSRFWDAINDPIVGGLTDKTKSRWGRYEKKRLAHRARRAAIRRHERRQLRSPRARHDGGNERRISPALRRGR